MTIRAIGVYCGSSNGSRPAYVGAARDLGTAIAERGIALVYGGGRVGLMGAVADAALTAGGHVRGIITHELLGAEVGHLGLSTLDVVASMHERKLAMAEAADGFIAQAAVAAAEGFVKPVHRDLLRVASDPGAAIDLLLAPVARPEPKWVDERP